MRRGLSRHCNKSSGNYFNPASLFASGEQGAWYDPSDLTTLFQDSAGTTPVTAVEQPVGLVLDKSKGLVLGPELVTNGDFSQGSTSWSLGTGWSVSNGQATHVAGVASYINNTGSSVVVGKCYKVTLDIISNDGTVYVFLPAGGANVAFSGTGTKTAYIFPTTSVGTIGVYCLAGTNATVDNVSVRELPGNHAYQTTSTSRPTLRARYNLLTYSEQFDNAAWQKTNATVTSNAGVAPDGTTTADLLYPSTTGIYRGMYQQPTLAAAIYVDSFYVKASGKSWVQVLGLNGAGGTGVWFNLSNGTVGTQKAGYTGTIQSVGSGWYRVAVAHPSQSNPFVTINVVDGDNVETVTASGTDGVLVWGAQIVPTAVFPSNTYQQITTSTSYATGAAFPPYLFFDGVDDSLLTNSVDFSATDKMTVWAGVTKSSDAAAAILAELSATAFTNNGAFAMSAPGGALNSFFFRSRGTSVSDTEATFAAPTTKVVTGIADIGADTNVLRVNGTQAATSATDQGTGNYGNYPLYIGRRGNATLPLNGNIYSLIIRGAQSTAAQISSTESWVAAKTPLGTL